MGNTSSWNDSEIIQIYMEEIVIKLGQKKRKPRDISGNFNYTDGWRLR